MSFSSDVARNYCYGAFALRMASGGGGGSDGNWLAFF